MKIFDGDHAEVKAVYAELLDNFIDICKENNLKYCLAYGTLLGAVREGGFIPWDHDVDVFMPYSDYIRLPDILQNKSLLRYNVVFNGYSDMHKQSRVFHLRKLNTACFINDIPSCRMFIDIFPVFDLNVTERSKIDLYDLMESIRYEINVSNNLISENRVFEKAETSFSEFCKKTLTNRDNLKSVSFEDILDYGDLSKPLDKDILERRLLPLIDFNNTIKRNFNGLANKVAIPENYDAVLRQCYGNYKIPVREPENRVWTFDIATDIDFYKNKGDLK